MPLLSGHWKRCLWLLVLAMLLRLCFLIRQREATDFGVVDSYAAFEMVVVGVTALALYASGALRKLGGLLRGSSLLMGLGLYVLGVFSAVWSPLRAYALFRSAEALIMILAVSTLIFAARSNRSAEKALFVLFAALQILTIGDLLLRSGTGITLRTFHTNSYSISAAMVVCYCTVEYIGRRDRLHGVFLVLSLATLVLGTSAGSNIAALTGLAIGMTSVPRIRTYGFAFIALLAASALLVNTEQVKQVLMPGKTQEEISSLSARTSLWEDYLQSFIRHPVLGQGFAVTPRISQLYETNSHNSVVAVAAGLGMLGLSVMSMWMLALVRDCVRVATYNQGIGAGCIAALIAGLVNCLSCAFIGEGLSGGTFMFFAFHAYLIRMLIMPETPGCTLLRSGSDQERASTGKAIHPQRSRRPARKVGLRFAASMPRGSM